MSTTTIRLPEELKARIDQLAASAGQSSHAFMVQALARTADQAEARQAFVLLGRERMAEFERTGRSMPWDEVRQYLMDRAAGRPAPKPKARKFKV